MKRDVLTTETPIIRYFFSIFWPQKIKEIILLYKNIKIRLLFERPQNVKALIQNVLPSTFSKQEKRRWPKTPLHIKRGEVPELEDYLFWPKKMLKINLKITNF